MTALSVQGPLRALSQHPQGLANANCDLRSSQSAGLAFRHAPRTRLPVCVKYHQTPARSAARTPGRAGAASLESAHRNAARLTRALQGGCGGEKLRGNDCVSAGRLPGVQPSRRQSSSRKRLCTCQAENANAPGGRDQEPANKMEFVFDPKRKMDDFASRFDPDQRKRTNSINLFSPSKINLFLRVTAKRPDGYHDLASLFHVIDLGDRLKFTLGPGRRDSLTCNNRTVPLGEQNLVIKALNLFRAKTGIQQYFWVHLDKKVPTGAGLGGGSGNAATALWAANELTGQPASNAQLLEWSADIGSDVPVFFSRGAAYCTGRGEIVEDIQPPPISLDTPMVLIKPSASCRTPDVFRKFSLERASRADPRELLQSIMQHGVQQEFCINDLEEPAFEVLPALKQLKDRVAAGGRGRYSAVFMSGSGSTFVGVGDPEPPPFIYDEERYQDVFTEAAYFLTREEGEWYRPSRLGEAAYGAAESRSDLEVDVPLEGAVGTSFFERPESSRMQF